MNLHVMADAVWVVLTLLLAWRVWRLESEAERRRVIAVADYRAISARIQNLDEMCVNQIRSAEQWTRRSIALESERRVADYNKLRSLATALGYEWKRTDAKEGWEKKNPVAFMHGKSFDWVFADDPPSPIRPIRKRTPQATPQAPRKAVEPPKAAARTAAKRGPQRAAR